jgi:protein-S-isoprenylcysteine O-methyltransferase Ste14
MHRAPQWRPAVPGLKRRWFTGRNNYAMKWKNDWSRWERTRKRGRAFFVIVYGVLIWGIVTCVFFSVVFPLMIPDATSRDVWPIAVPIFAVGGIFWGLLAWSMTERQYVRWLATQKNLDQSAPASV